MPTSIDINIKYFDTPEQPVKRLQIIQKGDWIDLYAAKTVWVPYLTNQTLNGFAIKHPLKPTLIPLGIGMQLPENYEAHLLPRSSTFKNWGIIQTNHMGVIDNSYCGDNDQWMMAAYCIAPHDVNEETHELGTWIHAGDKICQFRIVERMPNINFFEVDHLADHDRGGFGSTGTI